MKKDRIPRGERAPGEEPRDRRSTASAPTRALGLLQLQAAAGNRAVVQLLTEQSLKSETQSLQRKCIAGHLGPAKSHGVSMNALASAWGASGMQTKLRLSVEGIEGAESVMQLCETTSNQSVAHGAEHAEDVAIRVIKGSLGTILKPAPAVNPLWMSVTKSPCTSQQRNGLPATSQKVVGCTEELIDLAVNGASGGQYKFRLTVHVLGLYAPQVPGYTQQDVLDASQEALEAMRTAGINVTGDVRPGSRYEAQ